MSKLAKDELQRLLLEGLEGDEVELTDESWTERRRRCEERRTNSRPATPVLERFDDRSHQARNNPRTRPEVI
jgi:hypothetical protein